MPKTTNEVLLNSIQTLAVNMSRKFDDQNNLIAAHGERLAKIETHLETLVGDGSTGRIPKLEKQVGEINNKIYFWSGIGAAISMILSMALHWILPHRG